MDLDVRCFLAPISLVSLVNYIFAQIKSYLNIYNDYSYQMSSGWSLSHSFSDAIFLNKIFPKDFLNPLLTCFYLTTLSTLGSQVSRNSKFAKSIYLSAIVNL